jgi:membrane protein YdbS with pleckstrin-like domain
MKGRSLADRREVAVWIIVVILISALQLLILWFIGLGWFIATAFIVAVIFTVIVIPYRERKKEG